jgi:hypothetical protein
MTTDLPPKKTVALAKNATGWLKPLIVRASAVIEAKPL